MSVMTFSPDSVSLIFGGYVVEGWNNIAIERTGKTVKQIRGIRGKHAKEVSLDTSCTILLSVPQAMEVNTILSEIMQMEEGSRGGVRMEVTLKDTSGGSVFVSKECYLGGWPKVEYKSTVSELQWEFICDTSEWKITGNEANRNSLTDLVSGVFG